MRRPLGRLRIIGGEFRSRLIDFDAEDGVRPTPDRVRQTVFDWLAPIIDGARVLDLFAGSGALGFEALSRGASEAVFVEQGRAQGLAIRAAIEQLKVGERARLVAGDALGFIDGEARRGARHDLVFLDPPYAANLLPACFARLPALLAPQGRVYAEWPASQPPELPPGWTKLRDKQAGQVSFGLFSFAPVA